MTAARPVRTGALAVADILGKFLNKDGDQLLICLVALPP
jgi:hypothetical protein